MQKRDDTDQFQAEASWEINRFSQLIDTRHPQSIDKHPQKSIDINNTTSIDNHSIPKMTVSEKDKLDNQYLTPDEFCIFRDPNVFAKAIDGRTLHVSREDIRYPSDSKWSRQYVHALTKFYWEAKDEYRVYRDDREFSRDLDGHTIPVHNKDIRRLLERASRDEPAYVCLPEHDSQFTQTKLIPEIYTKDEISELFYGVCGEHDRNKEAFQMKLDGVYYPLNDSIS
ncbi:hypothetical protein DY000_02060044 [Brassica cretica]|uniref:Uncharacterized protein n=1 Tax=Brassica cretica TaxID=69181 RepID=A0ABQ7AQS3_BRACR|nr:hypothetical protein DY000_02060044 [Brassica cretica]